MTNLVAAIPSLLTYTNLAVNLMIGEANFHAMGLGLPEPYPITITNLVKASVKPGRTDVNGTIETEHFEYEFFVGVLHRIKNKRFLTNYDDLILPNPALNGAAASLTAATGTRLARQALVKLGMNIPELDKEYQVSSGPGKWIIWATTPNGQVQRPILDVSWSATEGNRGAPFDRVKLSFVNATKEIAYYDFWPNVLTTNHSIFWRPVEITNAADFKIPFFYEGEARVESGANAPSVSQIKQAVQLAVARMRENMVTNRAKAYLVCDNLNSPQVVAGELNSLLSDVPWAGLSNDWKTNLPFLKARMGSVTKGLRGIKIVAVDGEMDFKIAQASYPVDSLVRAFTGQNEWEETVKQLTPHAEAFLRSVESTKKDDLTRAMVFLGIDSSPQGRMFRNAVERAAPANTVVCDRGYSSCQNTIYYQGEPRADVNGIALIATGMIPTIKEFSDPRPRILPRTFSTVQILSSQFAANPLEEVFIRFGEPTLRILNEADRVEVFRIGSHQLSSEEITKGAPAIANYPIISIGKKQDRQFARDLSNALQSESNHVLLKLCIFDPGVAFRIWRGNLSVVVVLCFHCHDLQGFATDAEDRTIQEFEFDFSQVSKELAGLAIQAFPDDAELKKALTR